MEVKTSDVIIPFHPQYLPKHALLILQGGGSQRGESRCPKTHHFPLLMRSYDGAEICELVGLYILHKLETNFKEAIISKKI